MWEKLKLYNSLFILAACLLTNSIEARQTDAIKLERSSENDFSIPEINLEEWILRDPECHSDSPFINYSKAATDILTFTKEFQNLYKLRLADLDFEELRKYSFTINKSVDFLNKFPKFAKKCLPNLSSMDDIRFLENAIDIFSVLETLRHLLLEKMYRHIEVLSSRSDFETSSSRFESLLFGFRNHIRNEKEYLTAFIRSLMEARLDNIHIPSRYKKGALPGLDQLMSALKVSSPLQVMSHGLYRISLSDSEKSCLVQKSDGSLAIRKEYDPQACLIFRFIEAPSKDILIQVEESPNSVLTLRTFSPNFVSLTDKRGTEFSQFRILSLQNGNYMVACRLRSKTLYLGRTSESGEILTIGTYCHSVSNDINIEWKIQDVNK